MEGIAFGLAAMFLIGLSDFLGGRSSGRSTAMQTVNAAFWAGALLALVVAPFTGSITAVDMFKGAISGVAVTGALWTLWRGYVVSTMGITAPVAAVTGAVLPVLVDVSRGDGPGTLGVIGMALGVASLLLTSWQRGDRSPSLGIVHGLAAGAMFAVMFVVGGDTSIESGVWPIVAQRGTAGLIITILAIGMRQKPFAERDDVKWSSISGAAGAAGVGSIVLGAQRGPIGPVTVTGSLYPVVGIALNWLLQGERLRWWQVLGLFGAITGVALIAAD